MADMAEQAKMRTQLHSPLVYKIINGFCALLFAGAFLLIALNNQNTFYNYGFITLILCAVCGAALTYVLLHLLSMLPQMPRLAEIIVVIALFAIAFGAQLFWGWQLRMQPDATTAFGRVYLYAQEYVQNGVQPGSYFAYNPGQTGIYLFFTALFSVFRALGIQNYLFPLIVANTVAVNAAFVMLYLTARSSFGNTKALGILAACFFSVPFLCNILVPFGHTFTLPVVVGATLLWVKARKAWRAGSATGAFVRFVFASLLCAVGALLHGLTLLLWAAIVLDLLFLLRGKGKLKMLLAGAGVVLLVFGGGSLGLGSTSAAPRYPAGTKPPTSYWVMSGLGHSAESYAADEQMIAAYENNIGPRNDAIRSELNARVSNMGFTGVVGHLNNKLSYLLGDASYSAVEVLNAVPVRQNELQNATSPQGGLFGQFAYIGFVMQAALIFLLVFSSVKSIVKSNNYYTFIRLGVVLVVLFLLVWPAKPQALLTFVPVMMLCAAEAAPQRALAADKLMQPPEEQPADGFTSAEDDMVAMMLSQPEEDLQAQPAAGFDSEGKPLPGSLWEMAAAQESEAAQQPASPQVYDPITGQPIEDRPALAVAPPATDATQETAQSATPPVWDYASNQAIQNIQPKTGAKPPPSSAQPPTAQELTQRLNEMWPEAQARNTGSLPLRDAGWQAQGTQQQLADAFVPAANPVQNREAAAQRETAEVAGTIVKAAAGNTGNPEMQAQTVAAPKPDFVAPAWQLLGPDTDTTGDAVASAARPNQATGGVAQQMPQQNYWAGNTMHPNAPVQADTQAQQPAASSPVGTNVPLAAQAGPLKHAPHDEAQTPPMGGFYGAAETNWRPPAAAQTPVQLGAQGPNYMPDTHGTQRPTGVPQGNRFRAAWAALPPQNPPQTTQVQVPAHSAQVPPVYSPLEGNGSPTPLGQHIGYTAAQVPISTVGMQPSWAGYTAPSSPVTPATAANQSPPAPAQPAAAPRYGTSAQRQSRAAARTRSMAQRPSAYMPRKPRSPGAQVQQQGPASNDSKQGQPSNQPSLRRPQYQGPLTP